MIKNKKILIVGAGGFIGGHLTKKLLQNGKNLGLRINFIEQNYPKGLPDAFILGEKFIGKENVALILGDNFFYGQSLTKNLRKNIKLKKGAKVYLHPVKNPHLYGVAVVNSRNKIVKLIEKPKKTNYYYDWQSY